MSCISVLEDDLQDAHRDIASLESQLSHAQNDFLNLKFIHHDEVVRLQRGHSTQVAHLQDDTQQQIFCITDDLKVAHKLQDQFCHVTLLQSKQDGLQCAATIEVLTLENQKLQEQSWSNDESHNDRKLSTAARHSGTAMYWL